MAEVAGIGRDVATPCEVVLAEVSEEPTSAAALAPLVSGPGHGAVVTFDGVVRDHDTPGRGSVTLLDYEAHPRAGTVIAEVAARVAAGSSSGAVAVVHRVGPLRVGDCALAVAVSAAHRGDAFATAAALVDAVKAELPVWKHQHFADGSEEWVGLGNLTATS